MKHTIFALLAASLVPSLAFSQSAVDAYQLAQPDFKGTARFMSMGGAFGALGGDLSVLTQNPGGIGVYRSSEIGVTLDIDIQSVKASSSTSAITRDQTKVYCNNFGYIGAVYTGSDVMPYFNWGVSYSRAGSFDRAYRGSFGQINGSLSNYIAGYTSAEKWTTATLNGYQSNYNPYIDSQAPWMSILAYNAYMINPIGSNDDSYTGLWQNGTYGSATFDVVEKGYVDEYAIDFGGNVMNTLYWGVGFGITDINYTSTTYYSETLQDAVVSNPTATGSVTGNGGFGMKSWKHMNGSGFNFKAGVILRPINELRIGLAVHTPTYYNLQQEGWAGVDYQYSTGVKGNTQTNKGINDYFEWKFRTPWRLIASAAGVIGGKGIVSVDYEYRPVQSMSIRDMDGVEYQFMNEDIETYYKAVNILRLGAEYRIDRNWSVRAGYNFQSSPVTKRAQSNQEMIYTSGPDDTETTPSYQLDNATNYITCGIGYRYKNFYADAAYVHKHRKSEFHAYTPNDYTAAPPQAEIIDNNSQLVFSIGVKF